VKLFGIMLVVLVLMPIEAQAGEATCIAGRHDAFDSSDGLEPAQPSAALLVTVGQQPASPLRNFDECVKNHTFAHTITGCALDSALTSAVLLVRLKGDLNGETNNDRLMLGSGGVPRWGLLMNDLLSFQSSGGDIIWSPGDSATFVLDLGSLPPSQASPSGWPSWPAGRTDLLSFLRAGGDLDIIARDDTCVDAVTLQVNSTTPALPVSWGGVKVRYR
jgi:hypothetical protein